MTKITEIRVKEGKIQESRAHRMGTFYDSVSLPSLNRAVVMNNSSLPTQDLPVGEIFADPEFNCRGPIAPFDVIELVTSIEKNGLQQPIVVQPFTSGKYKWRVVMGHRRHKAHQILKKETIPCIVRPDLDETQARTMNLIENLERKDLTIMQEARAIAKFINIGQDEIAKMIGKSRGWVQVRITALKLPEQIQAEIDAGFVSQEQIKDLYSIPSLDGKYEAVRILKEAKLRGDNRRIRLRPPRKKNMTERKERNPAEIFEMQDLIRESIGNCFGTRCLAWAAGEISSMELLKDLQKIAEEKGKIFVIPTSI